LFLHRHYLFAKTFFWFVYFECDFRFSLRLSNFGTLDSIEGDVQVAKHWDNESKLKTNGIGKRALHQGQDCTAHNGQTEDS